VTHYLVQAPLESESYVYISRLVKTRDPHPGLLQFAILFRFPSLFQSAFLRRHLSLPLPLSTLLTRHRFSGGAVTPFSLQGNLVLASLVSENADHVLQATQSSPSRTDG
jgi:hypothetical protein